MRLLHQELQCLDQFFDNQEPNTQILLGLFQHQPKASNARAANSFEISQLLSSPCHLLFHISRHVKMYLTRYKLRTI